MNEEKERYYSVIDCNGNFELRDYECGKTIHSLFELDDLLNRQDKCIKELEKTKQYLDKVKSIYCNKCRCEIQKHYKDCVFRAFDNKCCGDLATVLEAYLRHCEINKNSELENAGGTK